MLLKSVITVKVGTCFDQATCGRLSRPPVVPFPETTLSLCEVLPSGPLSAHQLLYEHCEGTRHTVGDTQALAVSEREDLTEFEV